MSNRLEQNVKPTRPRRFSGLQVIAFLVVAVAVTAGITFWVVRTYIYPSDFEPVKLSSREQTTLDAKLRRLGIDPATNPNRAFAGQQH
jgi:arginine N-succinyltransferase